MKCQNETVTVELKNGMFVFIVAYLCQRDLPLAGISLLIHRLLESIRARALEPYSRNPVPQRLRIL
jgi:hypothetical protein